MGVVGAVRRVIRWFLATAGWLLVSTTPGTDPPVRPLTPRECRVWERIVADLRSDGETDLG